jgi:hypothetical protein
VTVLLTLGNNPAMYAPRQFYSEYFQCVEEVPIFWAKARTLLETRKIFTRPGFLRKLIHSIRGKLTS